MNVPLTPFMSTRYVGDDELRGDTLVRAKLALRTLRAASERGIATFVVDEGSHAGWLQEAKTLPYITIVNADLSGPGTHNMGRCRRQAANLALENGAQRIFYVDPEKYDLFENRESFEKISTKMDRGYVIVIPRRRSVETYPRVQREMEMVSNHTLNNIIMKASHTNQQIMRANREGPFDYNFGPSAWERDSARLFTEYTGEHGDRWESIFVPRWEAMKRGMLIGNVTIDYTHPVEQTASEEGDPAYTVKRKEQANALIQSAKAFFQK
jgi:hypothetical protein